VQQSCLINHRSSPRRRQLDLHDRRLSPCARAVCTKSRRIPIDSRYVERSSKSAPFTETPGAREDGESAQLPARNQKDKRATAQSHAMAMFRFDRGCCGGRIRRNIPEKRPPSPKTEERKDTILPRKLLTRGRAADIGYKFFNALCGLSKLIVIKILGILEEC